MGSGEKVAEKVLLDKTEKTVFRPLIMMAFLYSARQRTMEQRALKIVNNCLNSNIYSYLDTSGGQSSNLRLNVVHFFQHLC